MLRDPKKPQNTCDDPEILNYSAHYGEDHERWDPADAFTCNAYVGISKMRPLSDRAGVDERQKRNDTKDHTGQPVQRPAKCGYSSMSEK